MIWGWGAVAEYPLTEMGKMWVVVSTVRVKGEMRTRWGEGQRDTICDRAALAWAMPFSVRWGSGILYESRFTWPSKCPRLWYASP